MCDRTGPRPLDGSVGDELDGQLAANGTLLYVGSRRRDMPKVEVDIPDHIEVDIDRMVQEGEFLTRQDAVEELLSAGISAYTASLGSDGDDDEFGIGDEVRNPGSDAQVDDRFDP